MIETTARLLITCPDKPGIVAAVTGFLYSHGANITALDQYSTDPIDGVFFSRMEFQTPHLNLTKPALEDAFLNVVAERFQMDWCITYNADIKNVAILASKHDHCLLELLWLHARKELPCNINMVISNHESIKESVETFDIPFHHIPVDAANKPDAEQTIIELIKDKADLVVLARYMQILSGQFVSLFENKIINIHHSFLPAFIGADPYRQAYDKGVKIIGATAHYVTEELDMGPIIEQDVAQVSHRHSIPDLKNIGRELERRVLARAVKAHLEDRIIVYGNKTVVF